MRQASGGNDKYKALITLQPQREGFGLCGAMPDNVRVQKWSDAYKTLGHRGFSPEDNYSYDRTISRHTTYMLFGNERATLPSCYGAQLSRPLCHRSKLPLCWNIQACAAAVHGQRPCL